MFARFRGIPMFPGPIGPGNEAILFGPGGGMFGSRIAQAQALPPHKRPKNKPNLPKKPKFTNLKRYVLISGVCGILGGGLYDQDMFTVVENYVSNASERPFTVGLIGAPLQIIYMIGRGITFPIYAIHNVIKESTKA